MPQPFDDTSAASAIPCWRSDEPGRENLVRGTVERPVPGPREARIAVHAAALNFSDLLMLDDMYQVRPPRPFTPGQEVAGTVLEAGAESGVSPGARVAAKIDWGGFATEALVRGDMTIPLPDGVDFATGAALPISTATAMVALTELAPVGPGDTVLVHAASGALGIAAIQVARWRGARVIGTASTPEKRALAEEMGAEATIDYTRENWRDAVEALVGKYAVDVVFDSVGGDVSLVSLRLMARDGRLLVAGFASGKIPALPANLLLVKRIAAVGVYWNHDDDAAMMARVHQRIAEGLAGGHIAPSIEVREGLDALPGALDDLATRRTVGKVVLTLPQEI